jgi:hypothetical protein
MYISFDEEASSKKGCGASWLKRNSSYEATLHSEKVLCIKRITNGRPTKWKDFDATSYTSGKLGGLPVKTLNLGGRLDSFELCRSDVFCQLNLGRS